MKASNAFLIVWSGAFACTQKTEKQITSNGFQALILQTLSV